MKNIIYTFAFFLLTNCIFYTANAQLNTEAYFKYLKDHENMTAKELLLEYPAGVFAAAAPTDLQSADYFSIINEKYKFTDYEKELAAKNSFMVTERLNYYTYADAFSDAYVKDLPIYISSDAILHALHRSYDNMLIDIETYSLEPQLFRALLAMKAALKSSPVPLSPLAQKARNDADIYLTIALQLVKSDNYYKKLDYPTEATFANNHEEIEKIKSLINAETYTQYLIFGDVPRYIDFSQMIPRGHYADHNPGYFKAMMWLGRIEVLITKTNGFPSPTDEDIKRQCMLAVILSKLTEISGAKTNFESIDLLISKFVGEQDNLTLTKLIGINSSLNISSPDQLNDDALQKRFQDEAIKEGAGQQILSQMIWVNPFSEEPLKPGAAFMLMGQRFIFDSFILGNLVHDKVPWRMMPDPLDVMFTLGNDAAIQLLMPQINICNYAKHLAGLRYLSNALTKDYWHSSLYSTWLSAIRSLNPPSNRASLPKFMQTGAWWQKSLNTQLGSWAELRHDNILYGKQSYTAMDGCMYPKGYVEPVPLLYSTISKFTESMKFAVSNVHIDKELFPDKYYERIIDSMISRLNLINKTCSVLSSMAEKELRSEQFNQEEQNVIQNWITKKIAVGCTGYTYNGIYPLLMYGVTETHVADPNFIIADVHTQPTDEAGNMVGKVLHVGTGKVNMALIIAQDPADGCSTAYVGPVGSYYEYITEDFKRLTDKEWQANFYQKNVPLPPRPKWVNSYLSSDSGNTKGEQQNLFMEGIAKEPLMPVTTIQFSFTPNPMNNSGLISFEIPASLMDKDINVKIYSSMGECINQIPYSTSGNGRFAALWDGLNLAGERVSNGVYFVRITIGESSSILQFTVSK